jgi:hypothetical protein
MPLAPGVGFGSAWVRSAVVISFHEEGGGHESEDT